MKFENAKNIMVYVETANNVPVNCALEVLGKASEIAKGNNEEVIAVLINNSLENIQSDVFAAGADKIIYVEEKEYQPEKYIKVLEELVNKYLPRMILAGGTQYSKDIMPIVAKRFDTLAGVDVMNIREEKGKVFITSPVYSGTILNEIHIKGNPVFIISRPGAFAKNIVSGKSGEVIIETVPTTDTLLAKIVDVVHNVTSSVNLEEAEVIVAGGRGMGTKENFQLVEELAAICKGVVGATRPAIEDEWVPRYHQIGQSGKIVAPKLYIACGISGATQHVSGMLNSGYIIAINKDEDAAIFDVADVGIVGDVTKVMPLLIEEFKKLKEN